MVAVVVVVVYNVRLGQWECVCVLAYSPSELINSHSRAHYDYDDGTRMSDASGGGGGTSHKGKERDEQCKQDGEKTDKLRLSEWLPAWMAGWLADELQTIKTKMRSLG